MDTNIIVLFFLVVLSAFFSGAETAIFSLSNPKIRSFLKTERKGAKTLSRLRDNPHKLLITLLVGNNIVNMSASALTTLIAIEFFGSESVGVATGALTLFVLVFCEITPKAYAHKNAEKISLIVARPVDILSKALSPLIWGLEKTTGIVMKVAGDKTRPALVTYEELKTTISLGAEEGVIKKDEEEMLRNVFDFAKQTAEDIMIPRTEMFCIDVDTSPRQAVAMISKKGFSRIPVYEASKDNILGILHAKDLLKKNNSSASNFRIKDILRPAFFIPETKNLDILLKEFKSKRQHMAIVVDDSGGVEGLVTLEDLLEEIVGEIYDETDEKEVFVKKIKDGYVVDPRASIEEINSALGTKINDDYFNTFAGFVIHNLGRIPNKGEDFVLKNIHIKVEDAQDHKINRLFVRV